MQAIDAANPFDQDVAVHYWEYCNNTGGASEMDAWSLFPPGCGFLLQDPLQHAPPWTNDTVACASC